MDKKVSFFVKQKDSPQSPSLPLSPHFFFLLCGDDPFGGSAGTGVPAAAPRPRGDVPAVRVATPPRPASACRTARPAATALASPTASAAR